MSRSTDRVIVAAELGALTTAQWERLDQLALACGLATSNEYLCDVVIRFRERLHQMRIEPDALRRGLGPAPLVIFGCALDEFGLLREQTL